MDQQAPKMINLPDQRPWIAAEVLPDDQWITRYDHRLRHYMETWFERGLEYGFPRWVVAVLRIDVPLHPGMVRPVHLQKLLVVLASLRNPRWVVEGQILRLFGLQQVVQILSVGCNPTWLDKHLPVGRWLGHELVPITEFHWHVGVGNDAVPRGDAAIAGGIAANTA